MNRNFSTVNNESVKLKYHLLLAWNVNFLDVFLKIAARNVFNPTKDSLSLIDFFFRWPLKIRGPSSRIPYIGWRVFFRPRLRKLLLHFSWAVVDSPNTAKSRVLETILLPRGCCHRTIDDSSSGEISRNIKMREKLSRAVDGTAYCSRL